MAKGELHIKIDDSGVDIDVNMTEHELVIAMGSLVDGIKPNLSLPQQAAFVGAIARVMFETETVTMLEHLILATKAAEVKEGVR